MQALWSQNQDTAAQVGRLWSISSLHVGPDQPDPTPNPIPNPKHIHFGGSKSAGAATRLRRVFGWRFPGKHTGRPKS